MSGCQLEPHHLAVLALSASSRALLRLHCPSHLLQHRATCSLPLGIAPDIHCIADRGGRR